MYYEFILVTFSDKINCIVINKALSCLKISTLLCKKSFTIIFTLLHYSNVKMIEKSLDL